MAVALYTAAEVARVVGIRPGRLSYWVRTGLVSPSARREGRGLFCFEDLVAVKAATELLARGVSLQAVRLNLRALRGALPPPDELLLEGTGIAQGAPRALPPQPLRPRPLSRLRVVSDGEQLVVVEDDVAIEPLSGQVVMDFVLGSLSARAAEVLSLPAPARERSAWEWLQEAMALEDRGHDAEAEEALRRALEADPSLAAAHNNLGLLAQRRGDGTEARRRFEAALALDPAQPEARYNLAALLAAEGEWAAAVVEWRRVLAERPDFADAHFNLGATLVTRGTTQVETEQGRASLMAYLAAQPEGAAAAAARTLLERRPKPAGTGSTDGATRGTSASSPASVPPTI